MTGLFASPRAPKRRNRCSHSTSARACLRLGIVIAFFFTVTWADRAFADPVIAGAGDIACDPTDVDYNGGLGTARHCRQRYTSDLLVNAGLTAVLELGDTQYEHGSLSEFTTSYDPTWGRVKAISHPAVGNHEYNTNGAAGYFDYFNGVGSLTGAAGDRGKGYYSYDIGSWHLIALNTNDLSCAYVACGPGSAQEQWLRSDLATNHSACTLAYWHHPLFNSGEVGDALYTQTFWQDLYSAQADVVLNGHSHDYERFAPQDSSGNADPTNGIREFIVGTGGHDFHSFVTVEPNSQVRNNTTFGVLKLTLHPTSYDWQFYPEAGGTFTDSGTGFCHRVFPTVTIDSVSKTLLGAGDSSTTVTWHASENGSYSVRVGGTDCTSGTQVGSGSYASTPAQQTTTVQASALQEGANTIRVCVTDARGNPGSATTTVTKDTSAPGVAIDLVSDSLLGPGATSTDVTWHASDNGTFSVRVGGTGCASGTQVASGSYSSSPAQRTSTIQATALQEGANTVRVCVTDTASNAGSATTTITKDTTAPQVTIDSVSDNLLGPGEASSDVSWHATENGSYSVRVGGTSCYTGTQAGSGNYAGAPAQQASTVQASTLQEGANTIRVCVIDAAGNPGSATTTITKDTTAPQVTIDSVSDNLVGSGDAATDIAWHATENGSYSVRVGGTDCASGAEVDSGSYSSSPAQRTSTIQATTLQEGANTIRVCVTDAAANPGSATTTITKDVTAPAVAIDSVSDNLLGPGDTSTDVAWHASENGSYSIRVGGSDCTTGTQVASGAYAGAPAQQSTTVQARDLQEGANTVRVCVTDTAGNAGSATTTITKDTTAPQVTIDSVSDNLLGPGDTSTDVTWHSSENGSWTVRVGGSSCSTGKQVEAGSYSSSPAQHTTTIDVVDLNDGPNTIRVCVTDAAANTGSDSTVVTKATTVPDPGYSHPLGASPLRVSLVPAYQPCEVSGADSAHGSPLDFASCSHPQLRSSTAAIGPSSLGFARWVVCNSSSVAPFCNPPGGTLAKPDLRLTGSIRDVVCRGTVPLGCNPGGDYDPNATPGPYTSAGDGSSGAQPACLPSPTSASDCLAGADVTEFTALRGSGGGIAGPGFGGKGVRITDTRNGPTSNSSATVIDTGFPIPIDCMATPGDPRRGSACGVNTTANALVPGVVRSGDQAVWEIGEVALEDSGADGVRGNGDDELFAVQGIFMP